MLYFLIPVFNEEANLELLCSSIKDIFPDKDKFYVFVDDGSTDSTVEFIKKFLKDYKYTVLGDGKNHGPGYAFDIGFNWILENSVNDNDAIVTIEADNTSDITILDRMLKISDMGYGLVLASVYAQGGGFEKTSFSRKFYSAIANFIFRFIFDIQVLTLSSFYRVYRIKVIKDIKNKYGELIKETGFIAMLEILLKAISVNSEVIEVPMVLHSSRRKGKSKMKVFKTFMNYITFILKFKKR